MPYAFIFSFWAFVFGVTANTWLAVVMSLLAILAAICRRNLFDPVL